MKFILSGLCLITALLVSAVNIGIKNPLFSKEISKYAPGNKLFLSVPADGLPGKMDMCQLDTFKVDISNIQSSPQAGVNLEVVLPSGVSYVSNTGGYAVTTGTALNTFTLAIGTIAANPAFAHVEIYVTSSCDFYEYVKDGGTSRAYYKATYPGNSDVLGIIGNPAGYTNEFNPDIPALTLLSINPLSPNVTQGSVITKTVTIVNGGEGGLTTFDLTDIHGNSYSITSVSSGSVISNTATNLLVRFNSADIIANAINDDGDGILEQNERYPLILTLTVVNCNISQNTSQMKVMWGCSPGVYCDESQLNGGVTFGNIIPNLTVALDPASENPRCFGQNYKRIVNITNNGTGVSTAGEFKISCTWSTLGTEYNYSWMLNTIDVPTIKMKINGGAFATVVPTATIAPVPYTAGYDAKFVNCFGPLSSNVNAVVLALPDMNPGDVVTIEYEIKTCANQQCLDVDYTGPQNFKVSYKDACGVFDYVSTSFSGNSTNLYEPGLQFTTSGPSDVNGEAGNEDTPVFDFEVAGLTLGYPAYPGAKFMLEFAWGNGLTNYAPTLDAANFNLNGQTPIATPTITGNKLLVEYAYPFSFDPIGASIKLKLKATCAFGGAGINNISLKGNFLADGTCTTPDSYNKIRFVCSLAPLTTNVHCDGTGCGVGLVVQSLKTLRSSLGLPDNNNDGIPDGSAFSSNIKLNRVTIGDVISTTLKAYIKNDGSVGPLNHIYGTLSYPTSSAEMIPLTASIKVKRAGTTYSLGGITITSSNTHNLVVPATSIPGLPSGEYLSGDSIYITMEARNLENAGYGVILDKIISTNFYATTEPNPTLPYACNNYSSNYQNVGFNEYNEFGVEGSNGTTTLNGCSSLYFTCTAGKRFGVEWNTDPFPYESRASFLPNQCVFKIPDGVELDTTASLIDFYGLKDRIRFSLALNTYTVTSSQVIVDLYKYYAIHGGTLGTPDLQTLAYVSLVFKPTCILPNAVPITAGGRTNWQYLNPVFEAYQTDRGMKDLASGLDYGPYAPASFPIGTFYKQGSFQFNAPKIIMTTPSAVQDASNKYVSWTVNLFNPSNVSSAQNTYLAFSNASAISVLSVSEGATTYTPSAGGIYKLGTLGAGTTRTLLVKAIYTSCALDSISALAGWNCPRYPTGLSGIPCTPEKVVLKVNPLPGEIQASSILPPTFPANYCDQLNFTNRVTNTKNSYLFNIKNKLILSDGYFIVPSTTQIQYPEGAAWVTIPDPTVIGTNVYSYDISSLVPLIGSAGLPPVSVTDSNRYLIRYTLVTTCPVPPQQFLAGKQLYFQPTATTWCGKPTNRPTIVTQPYLINGVPRPYNTSVDVAGTQVDLCKNNTAEFKFSMVNLGNLPSGPNNPTAVGDSIFVTIPNTLSYAVGSATAITANIASAVTPLIFSNGTNTKLSWGIPAGVAFLDSVVFKFKLNGSTVATCDTVTDLFIETTSNGVAICATNNQPCNVKNITGQTVKTIRLLKPVLEITDASGVITGNNYVALVDVKNNGLINQSSPNITQIDFYCADGSGNPTGTKLYTGTMSSQINMGSTLSQAFSFTASACSPSVNIVAVISTSNNCICSSSQQLINFNTAPIANPNSATTVEDQPVTIPNVLSNDIDDTQTLLPANIDMDPITPGIQTTFNGPNGVFVVNPTTGAVTFTPNTGYYGTTTAVYEICDTGTPVACDTALIKIVVVPGNVPPVAVNNTLTTTQGVAVSQTITANDTDADGSIDPASVDLDPVTPGTQTSITTTNGSYSVASNGILTFTPLNPNFSGSDSITYTVLDNLGRISNVATVYVNVLPDNDGDGVNDFVDLDDDNDGILDTVEGTGDTDNDGIVDAFDLDSDNDGITDCTEANHPGATDTNGDGIIDGFVDINGDGVADTFPTGITAQDKDGDGKPNYLDLDSDNDGIADVVEAGGVDANNNGRPDGFADADGNGLSDVVDPGQGGTILPIGDLDGDALPNYLDLDADDDGIADVIESGGSDPDNNGYSGTGSGSSITSSDPNGWVNAIDGTAGGTALPLYNSDNHGNPNYLDRDSDNDGVSDAAEYFQGNTNGLNEADNDGVIDNAAGTGVAGQGTYTDTDGDGWSDLVDEVTITYATQYVDTDHDKDNDGKPNDMDIDSDSDGIPDNFEAGFSVPDAENDGIAGSAGIGNINDTDGDGLADEFDGLAGFTTPSLFNNDRESDGLVNYLDIDADNDGIIDNTEGQSTSGYEAPTGTDTDGDGLDDAYDVNNGGVAVGYTNSDGGSAPDYVDTDSENDGIRDIHENAYTGLGETDADNNGILDAAAFTASGDIDNDGLADIFDLHLALPSDLATANTNATNGGQTPNSQPDVQQPGGDRDWREGTDADVDGINDNADIDDDNDGITDLEEGMVDNDANGLPDSGNFTDSDHDGIADWNDLDSDNDGIPDVIEAGGSDPDKDGHPGTSTSGVPTPVAANGLPTILAGTPVVTTDPDDDFDNDGIKNWVDLDSDNDGIQDVVEAGGIDPDGNGQIGAGLLNDVDSDGLPDLADNLNELLIDGNPANNAGALNPGGTPLANADTDGDENLNVFDLDSDNDGVADIIEAGGVDTDDNGMVDGTFTDTDSDGWANTFDADNGGTVLSIPNTDGIGGQNFLDLDSDNDGITDIVENALLDPDGNGMIDTGTGTGITDTDNDGFADAVDEADGPELPNTDGTGLPNYADIDADDDGIVDAIESVPSTSAIPTSTLDTDGDGISDVYDTTIGFGGAGTSPVNTDNTDNQDYTDTDSDNDTKSDLLEGSDFNGDGVEDVLPSGLDIDKDGLDDTYDNNTAATIPGNGQTANSFPNVDNAATSELDWREILDTDGDGIANPMDLDDDNDGILDTVEGIQDTDGDGKPNAIDLDSDNDGIADVIEAGGSDPDNDGVVGTGEIPDSNNDGLADILPLTGIPNLDVDGDGNPNSQDLDADNDGIYDVSENVGSTGNPVLADVNNDGIVDGTDTDGDGLINVTGLDATVGFGGNTTPVSNTDGDGKPNYLDLDSDNDGILDVTESGNNLPDANHDGVVDGTDTDGDGLINVTGLDNNATMGGVANPAKDADTDGKPNYLDLDADNDGIYDVTENGNASLDTDGNGVLNGTDTDNDGIINVTGIDTNTLTFGGNASAPINFDGDTRPNYLDIDADNDGITDVRENGNASLDADNDGMIDGTDTDADGVLSSLDNVATFGAPTQTIVNTDNAGNGNYLDIDSDDDGIVDLVEAQVSIGAITPSGLDSDDDGLDNAYDSNSTAVGGEGLTPVNTDGADSPDYTDLDTDNDGDLDVLEGWDTDNNGLANTVPGGLDADKDGLDDAFDSNTASVDPVSGQNAQSFPNLDNVNNPELDWRDILDNDSDGITDIIDLDDDNDGILDTTEGTVDTDRDGIKDAFDIDSDNDGIPDVTEAGGSDPDNDGIAGVGTPIVNTTGQVLISGTPVALTPQDTDNDGKTNDKDLDSDNDGITDVIEAGGSDPDNDGLVGFGNQSDRDNDGLRDLADPTAGGTPLPLPDTDNDGKPNYLDLDSDNDGITDVVESGGADPDNDGEVGTGNSQPDTDHDGIVDLADANNGGTASPVTNSDSDNKPNYIDIDADNDGIIDNREAQSITGYIAPLGVDDDNDGLDDAYDANNGGIAITPVNTDSDTKSDYIDIDADNDGIVDNIESQTSLGYVAPSGNDTDGDGLDDAYDALSNAGTTPTNTDGADLPDFRDLDTDNDGYTDLTEGHDTNGDNVAEIVPSGLDTDNDGLDNAFDVDANATTNNAGASNTQTPNSFPNIDNAATVELDWRENADTDGDGIPNNIDVDDDNDGILDVVEGIIDTDGDGVPNVFDLDSDGDGIPDVVEAGGNDPDGNGLPGTGPITLVTPNGSPVVATQTIVLIPGDFDGDGKPNYVDLDADNDGINDLVESGKTTLVDVNNDGVVDGPDTDHDGLADQVDPGTTYGGINLAGTPVNTDGTAGPDYLDLDADNDGINDVTENNPELDTNGDGIVDGTDTDGDGIRDLADANPNTYGDAGPLVKVDTDGDGVLNYLDLDSDNDGINDVTENSPTLDTNGDGIVDGPDADGDGINDLADANPNTYGDTGPVLVKDFDGDGVPNYKDLDSDNDGINDVTENNPALDANGDGIVDGVDTDKDGIKDVADGNNGTFGDTGPAVLVNTDGDGTPNYLDLDSDNDGIDDVTENSPTLDTNGDGIVDGIDTDGDGIKDLADANTGTFGDAGPLVVKDFDGDGVPNYTDLDSDNDGINDVTENHPTLDTDGDGIVDGVDTDGDGIKDVADGNNGNYGDAGPTVLVSTDNDGTPDYLDLDSDNDGINDVTENNPALDTNGDGVVDGVDADGDGIKDLADANTGTFGDAGPVVVVDTDGDGKPDYKDLDSDNDGINDVIETNPTLDGNGDGVVDGADTDGDGIVDAADGSPSYGDGTNPKPRDTDGDGKPDYTDLDSDGDGIADNDGIENPFEDCDANGLSNYLDPNPCTLEVPQIFTPNGDGINDVVKIKGINTFPDAEFKILNRWGNLVYKAKGADISGKPWSGKNTEGIYVGGDDLPVGTYFYILEPNKEGYKTLKGYIYLQR